MNNLHSFLMRQTVFLLFFFNQVAITSLTLHSLAELFPSKSIWEMSCRMFIQHNELEREECIVDFMSSELMSNNPKRLHEFYPHY